MLIVQFVFGLVVIGLALLVFALVLAAGAWLIMSLLRRLPLIGRRHRHARWDELNRSARRDG